MLAGVVLDLHRRTVAEWRQVVQGVFPPTGVGNHRFATLLFDGRRNTSWIHTRASMSSWTLMATIW
jgi:hypothetical protein